MDTKAKKTANSQGKETPSIIIQNIQIRPVNRQVHDIGTWRNAIKSAEATVPRRTALYDLYDEILLDGHLSSVISKRINRVCNADWQFVKDGQVIEHINDLIDTPEFEELITEIVNSRFWGYTMMELTNFNSDGFKIFTVPRKHMRPERGIIATEQTGDTGINIREGIYTKTIMEVGKEKDLGILKIVAQYVIYKRGGFGDWAQYAEIFGMPFRKGTYDGFDDSQRVQLEKALEEAGSAAYAVIPKGTEIEFVSNSSTGNGDLYKLLKEACNQEISVSILGATETTTSSSSSGYAQSKTHQETEDEIFKGDRKYVRRVLNRHFIKILESAGIDTKGGKFVIKGEGEEKLTKKDQFEIHKSMKKDLSIPVDDNFFYENYGMPKPDDYDAQKKASQNAPTPTPSNQNDGNPKDNKSKKLVFLNDENGVLQFFKKHLAFFE